MNELRLRSAPDTEALGAALRGGLAPRRGAVIYLQGSLGAGKTTLVRGLLRALGVTGTIRSPTFTLMETYETPGANVLHMDLYRLDDARELHGLGLGDFPTDRWWWLVEWPQRGAGVLPSADLVVVLQHRPDGGRLARLEGPAANAGLLDAHGQKLTDPN